MPADDMLSRFPRRAPPMKTATAGASLGPERLPWPPDRARQRSVLAAAAGPLRPGGVSHCQIRSCGGAARRRDGCPAQRPVTLGTSVRRLCRHHAVATLALGSVRASSAIVSASDSAVSGSNTSWVGRDPATLTVTCPASSDWVRYTLPHVGTQAVGNRCPRHDGAVVQENCKLLAAKSP